MKAWDSPDMQVRKDDRHAERFAQLLRSQAGAAHLGSQTVHGGAFAMVAEGVEFALRLGSIFVLARLLMPEEFGLVAMVIAFTAVAERFNDLGLSVATIQRRNITHDQVSTLFWVNAATGFAIALLVVALAVPIARFYGEPRLVAICMVLASTFVFSGRSGCRRSSSASAASSSRSAISIWGEPRSRAVRLRIRERGSSAR